MTGTRTIKSSFDLIRKAYHTLFLAPTALSITESHVLRNDELIVRANHYEGRSFKVLSLRNGQYQEIYSTYYRGL